MMKDVLLKEIIEVKSLGNFFSMLKFIINTSLKPFTSQEMLRPSLF